MFSKFFRPKTLILVVLLFAIAAMTYGFAAQINLTSSNTVVASQELSLTNYDATLTWALNSGGDKSVSPTATVTFAAGNVPTAVYIGWADSTPTWDWSVTCTETALGSRVWECPFTGVNVYDIVTVEVVATGPN